MKKYLVDGKVYHFDILETCKLGGKHTGTTCYYAKCPENGKYAWLDNENGIQFEGESRFVAKPYVEHSFGSYTLWGGQVRPMYNWQNTPVRTRF